MTIMSKTQYAKARGVSGEAVRKWKHRGWLVLTCDGRVDVEKSDALRSQLRSARGGNPELPPLDRQAPLSISQRDFARIRGVHPATVSAHARKGRLVLTPGGRVDVDATSDRQKALGPAPGTMTRREYAKARGVSRQAVKYWARKSWLVLTPDGRVDVAASDRRRAALRDPRGGKRRSTPVHVKHRPV